MEHGKYCIGGITGNPQLGIVLEDNQSFEADEGSGLRLKSKKVLFLKFAKIEMVRLGSDESDNYMPYQNLSLLTPDYAESHTLSYDRQHERLVHKLTSLN